MILLVNSAEGNNIDDVVKKYVKVLDLLHTFPEKIIDWTSLERSGRV